MPRGKGCLLVLAFLIFFWAAVAFALLWWL
jgi:hypothetical protein